MRRQITFLCLILTTTTITSVCFVISDTPDKIYLNPYYVDIAVSIAGAFLIWDSWHTLAYPRLAATLIRGMVGAAILTIHLMQFVHDMARYHSAFFSA
jgi:hypothetical protein